jgi:competence protein ComEC
MIDVILRLRKSFVIPHFQKTWESQPAIFAALFLCLGISGSKLMETLVVAWWPAFAIPAFLLGLYLYGKSNRLSVLWIIGTFFLFLGLHLGSRALLWGNDFQPPINKCVINATVAKTLGTASNLRTFLLEEGYNCTEATHLPGKGRLALRDNDSPLIAGDRIEFRSRIRKPLNRGNPGEYDWEIDCKHNEILWTVSALGPEAIMVLGQGNRLTPHSILFRLRRAMSQFFDDRTGQYSGYFLDGQSVSNVRAIIKGLVLGDLGEITPDVYKSFVDSGLVHALSASGLHVAIVMMLVFMGVRAVTWAVPTVLLWLPFKKIGAIASIPAVIIYCLLVGARVPAIRSTIMGLVVAVAILMDRKWHSLNSLAVAAIIILFLYPLSFFTISFQLSFLAVAGILFLVPPITKHIYERSHDGKINPVSRTTEIGKYSFPNKVLLSLAVVGLTSFSATLAITPFLLNTFHSFPVYTIPANLLTDAMMTGVLGLSLLASFIGPIWPDSAALILFPAELLTYLIVQIAQFFSNLPLSTIQIGYLGTAGFIFMCGCVALIFRSMQVISRQNIFVASVASALIVATVVFYSWIEKHRTDLRVTFLNVGKADAIFLQPPSSKGALIDGGLANQYFDSGRAILLPFLKWSGVRSLDGMVMTHPDMDHMGGLLVTIPQIPPGRLWWNPVEVQSIHLNQILSQAAQTQAAIVPADRRLERVKLGSCTLQFLNRPQPTGTYNQVHRNINNASVVCRLDFGLKSFLFTGDLEREGEDELLATGLPLKASVLKVGHHGGRTSTSRRFLETVQPEVAVILNEYPANRGSPNKEVLARLESAGVRIFWTGRDGAVIINTDGKTLSINTGRKTMLPGQLRSQ